MITMKKILSHLVPPAQLCNSAQKDLALGTAALQTVHLNFIQQLS